VEKFTEDFNDKWNIFTQEGTIISLELNKFFYNPTITNGWNVLKQYYNLPNNVYVQFAYYGMNIFKVVGFHVVTCLLQLPPFHTRCFRQNESKYFDMKLWGSGLKKNNMVKYYLLAFN